MVRRRIGSARRRRAARNPDCEPAMLICGPPRAPVAAGQTVQRGAIGGTLILLPWIVEKGKVSEQITLA